MSSIEVAPVVPGAVQILGAANNNFTRIPPTIKQFCDTITFINLNNNNIEVIEATDLGTCLSLLEIKLKDNPIIYMEDLRYL